MKVSFCLLYLHFSLYLILISLVKMRGEKNKINESLIHVMPSYFHNIYILMIVQEKDICHHCLTFTWMACLLTLRNLVLGYSNCSSQAMCRLLQTFLSIDYWITSTTDLFKLTLYCTEY